MLRLNLLLAIVLLGSCVWLIRTSHESRRLFVALERAQSESHELQIDFERLEVDKRAQATPLRVERLAREKLRMFGNSPTLTHYVSASASSPMVAPAAPAVATSAAASGARP